MYPCSEQIIKKYGIVFTKKPVLCDCGKPAMVGDLCWRCHSIRNVGLEKTDFMARFEKKLRQE